MTSLALFPEPYARLQTLHAAAWSLNDHELLELGRRVLAATLCGHEAPQTTSPAQRAVVDFTERFALDAHAVAGEPSAELAHRLSPAGAFRFVAGLNVVEVAMRACTVLGTDAELLRGPRWPDAPAGEAPPAGIARRDYYRAVVDRRFARARAAYSASVTRLCTVDAVTTESVRLRNAAFQQCRF